MTTTPKHTIRLLLALLLMSGFSFDASAQTLIASGELWNLTQAGQPANRYGTVHVYEDYSNAYGTLFRIIPAAPAGSYIDATVSSIEGTWACMSWTMYQTYNQADQQLWRGVYAGQFCWDLSSRSGNMLSGFTRTTYYAQGNQWVAQQDSWHPIRVYSNDLDKLNFLSGSNPVTGGVASGSTRCNGVMIAGQCSGTTH